MREQLAELGLARQLPAQRQQGDAVSAQVNAAILRLVKVLRQQAGIPVRLPAHAHAPLRALPISFSAMVSQAGPGVGVAQRTNVPVQWSPTAADDGIIGTYGARNSVIETNLGTIVEEAFPDGELGVLTHVEVFCTDFTSGDAFDGIRQCRWAFQRNGEMVPGLTWQMPSGMVFNTILNVPKTFASVPTGLCRTPLRLKPGDKCTVTLGSDGVVATTSIRWYVRVHGFRYPAKGTDGTIYDVLVD